MGVVCGVANFTLTHVIVHRLSSDDTALNSVLPKLIVEAEKLVLAVQFYKKKKAVHLLQSPSNSASNFF